MRSQDFDRLFGLLAVQLGVVSADQVQKAEDTLADREGEELPAVLIEQGAMTIEQFDRVQAELDQLVTRHDGDLSAALKSVEATDAAPDDNAPPKHDQETVDTARPTGGSSSGTLADQNTAAFELTVITPGHGGALEAELEAGLAETCDRGSEGGPFGATFVTPGDVKVSERLDRRDVESSLRSRYTLTRVCGVGGIGEVWLAKDPNLNRDVALKRFRGDRVVDPDTQQRLVKEAQITGQLEHPNIVPVHELDQSEDGSPYYTMKLLRGQTLSQRIQEYHQQKKGEGDSTLALYELLNIFVDVCNAIAYAGARGIVHRDLKPANIMLGSFGEVLVLDWGLATLVKPTEASEGIDPVTLEQSFDPMQTVEGQIVGTPAYMAPEQAGGRISMIDQRTDVYGLGAVLYALLLGMTPHRGQSTGNVTKDTVLLLQRIVDGPTPRPRSADATVPAALDAICMKAMSRSRTARYQTATELAEDVKRWMADEPVTAFPEPWTDRARRWFRKHRTVAQAGGAAVLLIAVVSTVAAVMISGARQREAEAHDETKAANSALQIANAAERAARQDALDHFRRTRKMVDELLNGLAEGLLDLPGTQAFRQELLEYAAEEYAKLVAEDSDDPELQLELTHTLVRLGDVRRLLNQVDLAEEAYRTAIESLTGDESQIQEIARIRVKLGLLYAGDGRADAAEEQYRLVLDAIPEPGSGEEQSIEAWRLRAAVLANLGMLQNRLSRTDKAQQSLDQAEADWGQISGRSDADSDLLALAQVRVALGEHHQQTGKLASSLGKLQQAIADFRSLIDRDEDAPQYAQGLADALLTLAATQYLLGQTDEQISSSTQAINEYGALINSRPDVPVYRENRSAALTDLGQALIQQGRTDDALEISMQALESSMELTTEYPRVERYFVGEVYARMTLAQLLRDVEDFELAGQHMQQSIQTCDALIGFDEQDPLYHRLRGVCRSNLGVVFLLLDDLEQARELFVNARSDFENSLKLAPDAHLTRDGLAWALKYHGDVLHQLDRKDEATAEYQRAIELRGQAIGKTPNELANEAWLLLTCREESLRNATQALASAKMAVKNAPTNAWYQTLIGAAHYRNEDYEECLDVLSAARTPNISRKNSIGFWEAMALWRTGDQDAARDAFEEAAELMNAAAPGDLKVRTVRDEAAALLGIEP